MSNIQVERIVLFESIQLENCWCLKKPSLVTLGMSRDFSYLLVENAGLKQCLFDRNK